MENYRVQSVLFDKTKNTLKYAYEFLDRNGLKNKGVDEKEETYRFRQYNPSYLKKLGFTEYRTIPIDVKRGIQYVIVYKQISQPMATHVKKEIKGGLLMTPSKHI
jgi:hypothetical protein